jgi:tetratricopeptide (TPR) repeat protein
LAAKNIKIFIASAGEVKAEREKAILMLNHLSKSHRHLQLEPVEWEYDIVPGSQPGSETIQHSINPKLQESDLLVFIFYSRIGQYTRQEFELATAENKKFFAFFKSGFSPANKTEHDQYGELLDFKDGLNSTVLHVPYKDADSFGGLLYQNLNQYLSQHYPGNELAVIDKPMSAELSTLIKLLGEKEERIKQLEASTGFDEIQQLTVEIAAIREQLAQSEELRQQQAADKAALEQQLGSQKDNNQLKAQALQAVERGDYAAAENLLQESAKDSFADAAATFHELAKLKKLQLQYQSAFEFYELAVKIEPDNSTYLNDAGVMALHLSYIEKAVKYCEKSLSLCIIVYGEQHPEIATRYNNLGVAYSKIGEYEKGINYCKKALHIGKALYEEGYPDIAIWQNNLGEVYRNSGEYDKAISCYEQAIAINKEFYGKGHPDIAIVYNNLGLAYGSKGKYDIAANYCEQALDIGISFYGEHHPFIATRYNNLGLAYYKKKRVRKSNWVF